MSPELDYWEREALQAASEEAGAYLEKLGKFDIALLSPSEWMMLLRTIYISATDKVRELRSEDEIPF